MAADTRCLSEADAALMKMRTNHADKLQTLCKMHLSFLLDLPGSSLDQFLGASLTPSDDSPDSSRTPITDVSTSTPAGRWFARRKKDNKHGRGVFGVPVTHDLLTFIRPLIDHLNKPSCLQQEGLFRKTGNITRQRVLRELVEASPDTGTEVVITQLNSGNFSPHDVASLLKSLLGETPQPLLTEKHFVAHLQLPDMTASKQLQTVQLLLQLLPPENLQLLNQLLQLLVNVVREETNKMTAETLATLFAPHIMVPRKMTASELQVVSPIITKSVSFMINHSKQIFEPPVALMRDVTSCWQEIKAQSQRDSVTSSCSVDSIYQQFRTESSDVPVHTILSFADREASQLAARQTDTQVQLAELYAYVSKMPDSTKKKKILKQFTKANGLSTPQEKHHKRSRSLGESLKKMVHRHHKRRGSNNSVQLVPANSSDDTTSISDTTSIGSQEKENQPLSNQNYAVTPIIKCRQKYLSPNSLVGVNCSPSQRLSRLKTNTVMNEVLPSSPRVHIVEMCSPGGPLHPAKHKIVSPSLSDHSTRCSPISRPWFQGRTRSSHLQSRLKSAEPSSTPKEKPSSEAILSPITQTMSRASTTLKASMMTPGSRKPMAVLQTP